MGTRPDCTPPRICEIIHISGLDILANYLICPTQRNFTYYSLWFLNYLKEAQAKHFHILNIG